MFAVPGIAALVVFILARPQEFLPLLQRVPFLHLFTALAVLGWVIDIRLRRLQPIATPALPWACAFLGWALVSTAITVPEQLLSTGVQMAILFALYATIAHGVQRFRTLQAVAAVVMLTCLFIAAVCFHQGLSPTQCVGGQELANELAGKPDGRLCEISEQCYGPDAEPGLEYRCEHVGMFGTYSVEQRVRYRGELQDPNEVALCISAGALALLIAFMRRRPGPLKTVALIGAGAIVVGTLVMTQSRGGQVAALLVIFVYLLKRFGWMALIPAAAVGIPFLLLGGRGGADADMSTMERYEAWATGLSLFKQSPIWGVGAGQFVEHHYLTAHNSFVLALAELGFVGMFLFVCVIYVSAKTLIVGVRQLGRIPGAHVAEVWGMALLAAFAGIVFQINTLSFTFHSVLWIVLGLIGAWTGAVRHHQPDFSVRLTWRDLGIILVACGLYAFGILPMLLKAKGMM
jgi:hypothetical protein